MAPTRLKCSGRGRFFRGGLPENTLYAHLLGGLIRFGPVLGYLLLNYLLYLLQGGPMGWILVRTISDQSPEVDVYISEIFRP